MVLRKAGCLKSCWKSCSGRGFARLIGSTWIFLGRIAWEGWFSIGILKGILLVNIDRLEQRWFDSLRLIIKSLMYLGWRIAGRNLLM